MGGRGMGPAAREPPYTLRPVSLSTPVTVTSGRRFGPGQGGGGGAVRQGGPCRPRPVCVGGDGGGYRAASGAAPPRPPPRRRPPQRAKAEIEGFKQCVSGTLQEVLFGKDFRDVVEEELTGLLEKEVESRCGPPPPRPPKPPPGGGCPVAARCGARRRCAGPPQRPRETHRARARAPSAAPLCSRRAALCCAARRARTHDTRALP